MINSSNSLITCSVSSVVPLSADRIPSIFSFFSNKRLKKQQKNGEVGKKDIATASPENEVYQNAESANISTGEMYQNSESVRDSVADKN